MDKYKIIQLKDKLEECRKKSIKDIKLDDLDDLTEIKVNRKQDTNERIVTFINDVKNPYAFKIDGKLVIIEFSNNNKKADDSILNVIESLYK